MTGTEFERHFEARVEMCRRVLIAKNQDYARGGDKLHNFKAAGILDGVEPETALKGMLLKHWQSLRDMVDDTELKIHHPLAVWHEKIGDALNYLFLLHALIEERYKPWEEPELPFTESGP